MPPLTLATFNINHINKRLDNLREWLERAAPDIVCLQELKATDKQFPAHALREAGYHAIWKGEHLWNGVAILSKGIAPIEIRRELPGDPGDAQSRYLEAAVQGIIVGCVYLPNGNPIRGPKFQYKLAWLERLIAHAQSLYSSGHPVALVGDFNVVPTDDDIYNPKSWTRDALLQPESRASWRRLLAQGWVDSLRVKYPDEKVFTFWDYFREHWQRNAGLRIDHLLLNPELAPRLVDAGVDSWVRGRPNASDHAPTWIRLAGDAPPRRRRTSTKPRTKRPSKR
ncbi:MAG TPA: exodeoxyribonuclease III [Kofleriaceae bacterium]|nr:exodeoxyribonuclease III [Kofleriaceae bacterium]